MQDPEDMVDFAGLHQFPDGPCFVMPHFGRPDLQTTTNFALEGANAYLKHRGGLDKIHGAIKFIGAKGVSFAVTVLVSELLDTTIVDILETVGDSSTKAAVRALNDAGRASTSERRDYHRHSADVLLRLAFENHRDAIGRVGFWANFANPTRICQLHEKATQAAVLVALIADRAEDSPAVSEWAEHARRHFSQYYKEGVKLLRDELPQLEFPGQRAFAVLPQVQERTKKTLESLAALEVERRTFDVVHHELVG